MSNKSNKTKHVKANKTCCNGKDFNFYFFFYANPISKAIEVGVLGSMQKSLMFIGSEYPKRESPSMQTATIFANKHIFIELVSRHRFIYKLTIKIIISLFFNRMLIFFLVCSSILNTKTQNK